MKAWVYKKLYNTCLAENLYMYICRYQLTHEPIITYAYTAMLPTLYNINTIIERVIKIHTWAALPVHIGVGPTCINRPSKWAGYSL